MSRLSEPNRQIPQYVITRNDNNEINKTNVHIYVLYFYFRWTNRLVITDSMALGSLQSHDHQLTWWGDSVELIHQWINLIRAILHIYCILSTKITLHLVQRNMTVLLIQTNRRIWSHKYRRFIRTCPIIQMCMGDLDVHGHKRTVELLFCVVP